MSDKTISHYKIIEKSGGGETGVVYKAGDTRQKRTVAFKEALEFHKRKGKSKTAFIHSNIISI